jgi:hypothetical protein
MTTMMLDCHLKTKRQWKCGEQSIKHINGHYEMCIPFQKLSWTCAKQSTDGSAFTCITGQEIQEKSLAQKYVKGMSAMLESGYAEPVDCSATEPSRIWYLPH